MSRLPRAGIALLISILLWLYVSSTTSPTVYPSVNVELRNLPDNLTLVGEAPTVSIRVQDYSADAQQPVAFVDLAGAHAGVTWVPVQVQGVKNAQVLSVYPSQVRLTLERTRGKKIPVTVEPAPGQPKTLTRARPKVAPSEVTVSGSKQAIAKVDHVVAIVQQGELQPGQPASLTVQAVDRHGNPVDGVTVFPKKVQVVPPQLKPTVTPSPTGQD